MAAPFDPYAAKLARYQVISAKYLALIESAGPDVSERGRSINWSNQLDQLREEMRMLENELRMMSPGEVTTVVFQL